MTAGRAMKKDRRAPAPAHAGKAAPRLARLPWLLCAALPLLAPLPAASPAAAQAQAPCVDINNTTENWWPVRMRLGTAPPQQLRIDARTFGRLCLLNTPHTDQEIHVSVRSTWMPVGECSLPPGGQVTIERRAAQDGTASTHVICSPPR